MKKVRKYLMMLFLTSLSLITASCSGNDDNGDEPTFQDTLSGQWIHENISIGCDFIIYFDPNGSGWMKWTNEDDIYDFVYQVHGNQILFSDEYDSWICNFEFKNTSLVVYGNLWGEDDDIDLLYLKRLK